MLGNEVEKVQKKWMYIDDFVFVLLSCNIASVHINEYLAVESGGHMY